MCALIHASTVFVQKSCLIWACSPLLIPLFIYQWLQIVFWWSVWNTSKLVAIFWKVVTWEGSAHSGKGVQLESVDQVKAGTHLYHHKSSAREQQSNVQTFCNNTQPQHPWDRQTESINHSVKIRLDFSVYYPRLFLAHYWIKCGHWIIILCWVIQIAGLF